MKIALINSLYKPYRRGGAEVVFNSIVKELKKDGHDVFVITISGKKDKTGFFLKEMDSVSVYRFYPKNIFSFLDINKQPVWKRAIWHLIDTFNYHSYRQVKKILKKEKPDLVLSHNLKGLGYLIPVLIRRLKIKHYHTLHDVQLVKISGLIIKGQEHIHWLYKQYAKITRCLFKSPMVVISPSKWLLDFYKEYKFFPKSKKVVIANPITLEENEPKKVFTDDKINFLFLGQLEEHKGVLFIIKIFENYNQRNKCRLIIVGSGSLESDLREKYKNSDWLEFLGYIPANQLGKRVFKIVHYTILPSICYENSPGVIYDSFKSGTPVIAADIGGIPELVQEGVDGYLFEPGNRISLINKLNYCLTAQDKFPQLSENAKIKARDYDIKKYIYKILSL